MATAPIFVATPKLAVAQISAANTNRDGTGTIVSVYAAGANGSRIDSVKIAAIATTTAGVVRLYIHDGTNIRLWKEILVTAITPSTSVAVFMHELDLSEADDVLILPVGFSLQASTHNAETFNVFAVGGDF